MKRYPKMSMKRYPKMSVKQYPRMSMKQYPIRRGVIETTLQGQIQDFKLGRTHLKNCAGRREARKMLGYFVWKITILRQKIIFFPILGGGAPGAPPGSAPALCDQVCQWFSPGTPVSSTNKTDSHDITEILLKVAWTPSPISPQLVMWKLMIVEFCCTACHSKEDCHAYSHSHCHNGSYCYNRRCHCYRHNHDDCKYIVLFY